jgi:hypothetical protein
MSVPVVSLMILVNTTGSFCVPKSAAERELSQIEDTDVFLERFPEHFGHVLAFRVGRTEAFRPADKYTMVNFRLTDGPSCYMREMEDHFYLLKWVRELIQVELSV